MKQMKRFLIACMIIMLAACAAKSEHLVSDEGKTSSGYNGSNPPAPTESYDKPKSEIGIPLPNASLGDKIIYTIGLDMETKEYTKTIQSIEQLTKSLGGYIQTSSIPRHRDDESFGGLIAYFTIMVPTSKVSEFISSSQGFANIVNENRKATNITQDYTDTEMRIKSLKAKETRLLELLKKSGTLSDLLQIESELSNTRYQIEQLENTLRNYDNRIDYTQMDLTVTEVYTYSPAKKESLWDRIAIQFSRNLNDLRWSLESLFIFLVSTLPFILLQLLIIILPLLLVCFVLRRPIRNMIAKRKGNPIVPKDESVNANRQQG